MPLLKELIRAGVHDGRSRSRRAAVFLEKTDAELAERINANAILIRVVARVLAIRNSFDGRSLEGGAMDYRACKTTGRSRRIE
jgi:hypothetical protein